jgi:hypothetical protein
MQQGLQAGQGILDALRGGTPAAHRERRNAPAMCRYEYSVPPRWDGNAFAETRTEVRPCTPPAEKKGWCVIL